ncbi:DNA polymerase IV [Sinimarinibacterium sp. NLF-5-8]|uniref:DNA polymerase IV n=1 Tax=Sinimarinibacterium sp. NLF-5-8 TaxID=2698684 RepID=UPI00137BC34D|nr:DNA polymerase IV [Sinimarinibacterium sp. NLF-5-8]QHS09213.1 DNA polymerase IV [Sinimarinibacterium sp. NLF-5-8]
MRKIIHVDMDAFYASVEQRDDPLLRGKPVVVAWNSARSVVCAASYEARQFGVHSAMAAMRAQRLCPHAIFVPPDFARYRAVSRQVRAIFARYTDLIEPLSLDEAYLDVSDNRARLPSATATAAAIRAAIFAELHLTASAGIAPNKFLAKIASDWRKPNGQFVIRPAQVLGFLQDLPVARLPGVGKVTHDKLRQMGIRSVGDLRLREASELERRFGRYGLRLALLAQGIDEQPVQADRPTQSISSEDTFSEDLRRDELVPELLAMADKTWQAAEKYGHMGRTVVLKLKTTDFRTLTRSITPPLPPKDAEQLRALALQLLARVALDPQQRYRLVGVGLSNFVEGDGLQASLFSKDEAGF